MNLAKGALLPDTVPQCVLLCAKWIAVLLRCLANKRPNLGRPLEPLIPKDAVVRGIDGMNETLLGQR